MKTFIAAILAFASVSAIAGSVKITSFVYATSTSKIPLAEICGTVEGVTAPAFVQVTIDPNGNKGASYNTYAGTNGKFCMAVVTYQGNAEVSLLSGEKTEASIR